MELTSLSSSSLSLSKDMITTTTTSTTTTTATDDDDNNTNNNNNNNDNNKLHELQKQLQHSIVDQQLRGIRSLLFTFPNSSVDDISIDSDQEMTQDEMNKLVHNALRRARKATTPKRTGKSKINSEKFGKEKLTTRLNKTVSMDATNNNEHNQKQSASYQMSESLEKIILVDSMDSEQQMDALLAPTLDSTDGSLGCSTDRSISFSTTERSINSSDSVLRKVEAKIQVARKQALDNSAKSNINEGEEKLQKGDSTDIRERSSSDDIADILNNHLADDDEFNDVGEINMLLKNDSRGEAEKSSFVPSRDSEASLKIKYKPEPGRLGDLVTNNVSEDSERVPVEWTDDSMSSPKAKEVKTNTNKELMKAEKQTEKEDKMNIEMEKIKYENQETELPKDDETQNTLSVNKESEKVIANRQNSTQNDAKSASDTEEEKSSKESISLTNPQGAENATGNNGLSSVDSLEKKLSMNSEGNNSDKENVSVSKNMSTDSAFKQNKNSAEIQEVTSITGKVQFRYPYR